MSLFWSEFLFFATAMFGILVAFSVSNLFYQTLRAEHHEKTVWRAVGFLVLVFALILFVLERKYGFFGLAGVILEAVAFYLIYRGVLAQPRLSILAEVRKVPKAEQDKFMRHLGTHVRSFFIKLLIVADIIAIVAVLAWLLARLLSPDAGSSALRWFGALLSQAQFLVPYLSTFVILISLVFILLTIQLQFRRLRDENLGPEVRRNNFFPLIGYVFFAIRAVALAGYRLPDLDMVWTRFFNGEYSNAWLVAAVATAFGFLFLALWAWRFIRVRFFLRTYVVFLALSIAVATASVLIFSLLIFRVVESNNLQLMARGADTEALIMVERKNVAETIARLLAEESRIVSGSAAFDDRVVNDRSEFFRRYTNVDTIRLFSPQREVLSSATDRRDVGRVFSDDALLQESIRLGKTVSSFDVMPGVLSDVLVGRSLYPTTPMSMTASVSAPLEPSLELSPSAALVASITAGTNIALTTPPPSMPVATSAGSTGSATATVPDGLGVFEVAYAFDNAFVDYSKEQTGLEVTMYTGSKRSASTILTVDGTSRWVGSNETEPAVLTKVLQNGENYQTSLDRLGIPYYSAFRPVRDVHGSIVGMVSVGVPSHILLEEARQRLLSSFFMATMISVIAAIAGYFAFKNFQRKDPTG